LRGICFFRLDAMYLFWIHRGFAKHRFVDHSEVAVWIVGRYVALIAEEKLDLAPRDLRLQHGIGR
jgi:hypothetical protein